MPSTPAIALSSDLDRHGKRRVLGRVGLLAGLMLMGLALSAINVAALSGSSTFFANDDCTLGLNNNVLPLAGGRTGYLHVAFVSSTDRILKWAITQPDSLTVQYDVALHERLQTGCQDAALGTGNNDGLHSVIRAIPTTNSLVRIGSIEADGVVYASTSTDLGLTWIPTGDNTPGCGWNASIAAYDVDSWAVVCLSTACGGGNKWHVIQTDDAGATWDSPICITAGSSETNTDVIGIGHNDGGTSSQWTVYMADGRVKNVDTTGTGTITTPSYTLSGQPLAPLGQRPYGYIGTDFYVMSLQTGLSANTFDLDLWKNGAYYDRLTIGEDLGNTQSAIQAASPFMLSDNTYLYITYVDDETSQRVFLRYDPATDVGETHTFESAAIGNPRYLFGFINNGLAYFIGTDVENSAATGNRGLYLVGPWTVEGTLASATASVTSLVGFDVDPTGAVVIARTDSGDTVQVFPGGSLGDPAEKDTDCVGSLGGVAAMASHVAYFDCDSGGDVIQVEIRSPGLTSPTQPPICNNAGFCLEDIPTEDCGLSCVGTIEGDQDDDTYLAIVEEFPIDYSQVKNGFLDDDAVYMAMAFADNDGRLGVWTYVMNNNGDDESEVTSVSIASTTPEQICSHRDPDGTTYLYGSSQYGNVRGFRVTFKKEAGSGSSDNRLVPSMTSVFPGTAATSGAFGVACGDQKFAILNEDKLTIWNRTANGQSTAPYLTLTGLEDVPLRGVAMSHNGFWTAYVSGGFWHLVNNVNGTEAASGPIPGTGSFRGIELNGCGGDLWVATSTTIERTSVYPSTTGYDCVYNPIQDPNDLDGDGLPNDVDDDIDGDGILNENDSDDDGDGIVDTLDPCPSGPCDPSAPSETDFGESIFGGIIAGGTVLFGNEVGGRLFATVILILGFAGVGAVSLSRPAAKNAVGEDGWLWGLTIGAALGFLIAIGTDVFPKKWAFVGVIIAAVAVAIYYGRRK